MFSISVYRVDQQCRQETTCGWSPDFLAKSLVISAITSDSKKWLHLCYCIQYSKCVAIFLKQTLYKKFKLIAHKFKVYMVVSGWFLPGQHCWSAWYNVPWWQGCQMIRNLVRISKILIARSTIQPKLSKIKNH